MAKTKKSTKKPVKRTTKSPRAHAPRMASSSANLLKTKKLLKQGMTRQQIAKEIGVSISTVGNYVAELKKG